MTNTVVELAADSGRLTTVMKGKAYRLDGPLAITTDGKHVWIASSRSNSLTEVNAETGAFIRFLHGAQLRPQCRHVDRVQWRRRLDDESRNLRAQGHLGERDRPPRPAKVVKVLSGAQYHFDLSNAITYIGNRVWVANQGSNSLTESVRPVELAACSRRAAVALSRNSVSRTGPADVQDLTVPLVAGE